MVLKHFSLKSKPVFSNGLKGLPILANELFAKALEGLETCVLVKNNLCGKLYSSLELLIAFDERLIN